MKGIGLPKTAGGQVLMLLRPYRWHVLISVFLVILPGYFTVWQPYLMGRLIDDGVLAKDISLLWKFGLLILSIKVCLFLFNSGVTYCLSAFGLQILVDYREKLLNKILHYPTKFFDSHSAGTLTTRLTSDVNSVQELFSTALVPLIGNIFMVIGVFVSMFIINWKLALVASTVLPFLIWLNVVFDERIRRRFGFVRKTISNMNSFASEALAGSRDIRALAATEAMSAELESFSNRLRTRNVKAVREYALFNPTVPFLTAMMDVLILIFGGFQVAAGTMSVGEVVAFLGYASLFAWPIRDFAEKYTVLQQALAAVDRLVEVSSHDIEANEGRLILSTSPSIEFKGVQLTYNRTTKPALREIDFRVEPGAKVALIGETGSGKTSTCALLMRLYEAEKGEILLNGKRIQDYELKAYRSQLGWVSQDVFLFSQSLRENLRFYGSSSDQEIWKALERVQLKSFVERLPGQLDAVLLERAAALSSGQKQLLSMARALLRKPKILIFDEATSAVDSLTEFTLQRALERLFNSDELKSTTCFFIAHRLSTIRRCDQMFVYRHGQIVERGTYEELMNLNGYAASLFREQFKHRGDAA